MQDETYSVSPHEAAIVGEQLMAAQDDAELVTALRDLFETVTGYDDRLGLQTFEEAGVLTSNAGLVVANRRAGVEFQLTVVRSG